MLCETRTSCSMRVEPSRVQGAWMAVLAYLRLRLSAQDARFLLHAGADSAVSSASRSSMLQDPNRESLHRVGRKRLLNRARLRRQAHIAMLKLMIEPRQLDHFEVLIPTVLQRFLNQRQILFRRHLAVPLAPQR